MLLGNFKLSSVVVGTFLATTLAVTPSKADFVTDRIIQNVIQNILQDVRDQVQTRRLTAPLAPGRSQFAGEDVNALWGTDDPFAALGYAKAPAYTKAPPAPPAPTYIYGINAIGSGDWSRAAGITTRSLGFTGAVDFTKIGVFSANDALTIVLTGTGVWSHTLGTDVSTGVGAGTIAYINGGFSTDFTVDGTWTSTSMAALGIASTNGTGVSYSPNVQYKFELGDNWYIEPTVGATYTQVFTANFGNQIGDSTEVHGGARVGTETTWNGVHVQPSLKLEAFSLVAQSGGTAVTVNNVTVATSATNGIATGQVGGRASGKLNFIWTPAFSTFVEAHGSGIAGLTTLGATGGLRWTF
jgi:hypothetical protein